MKKIVFSLMMALAVSVSAKDIQMLYVSTSPQMHCANCEKKIKGNLRFEKGVKKIETDVKNQVVIITYDAEKTTKEKLMESFSKFGYKAIFIKEEKK